MALIIHMSPCYEATYRRACTRGSGRSSATPRLEGAQSEVIGAILMPGERIASQSEVIGAIVSG